MTTWLVIVQSTVSVFAIVMLGAFARHRNWMQKQADACILNLIISFLMPSYIFHTVLTSEYLNPQSVWKAPLLGAGSVIFGMLIGAGFMFLFGRKIGLGSPASQRAFVTSIGIFNYGYLPIPLINDVFKPDGETLGILFIHNFGVELTMLTLGVVLISGQIDKNTYRKIFNPPAVTLMISLILKFLISSESTQSHVAVILPIIQFAIKITDIVGDAAIPLGLLLVGATILDEWLDAIDLFDFKIIFSAIAVRLCLLPAMLIGLIWTINYLFPRTLDTPLLRVTTTASVMPSAIFPIVLCRHYGGDTPTAVRVALATCIASLLTIPPSLLLCWRIFPNLP